MNIKPQQLLNMLYTAANARTNEQKARVAWRASDWLWWNTKDQWGAARAFNDYLHTQALPWVENLWEDGEEPWPKAAALTEEEQ